MIPFIDLQAQRKRLGQPLEDAILKVVRSGAYIMGPEIAELERQLAQFGQAPHALSCGSGTEALILPLMAWEIGPGDAVFCPSFTFAATAEVMPLVGAAPVFVDIDPATYNLDPKSLEAAIDSVKAKGELTPRAVIAVDLFGQPADYPAIAAVCARHGLKLIADSAQGFGCTLGGRHPISWADVATTSFFPAKPLGCYGDGGAVLCKDDRLQDLFVSLRVHGQAVKSDLEGRTFDHDPKYLNLRVGLNARMDTVQAAVLIEKLKIFEDEIAARNRVADRYAQGLGDLVGVPAVIDGGVSVWAQYTIELPEGDAGRDGLGPYLRERGVPTAVYYPIPIHRQDVYSRYPTAPDGLPVTDAKAGRVISLPMHAYLTEDDQDQVIAGVRAYVKSNA